jgi:hypothetical protein
MQLNEFISKIYNAKGNYGNVVSVTSYYDKEIILNESGEFFVDGVALEQTFECLDDVKEYIDIQEEAFKNKLETIYEDISVNKVASTIKKYDYTAKITNHLIESYIGAASSKRFTIDPIILEMRMDNRLDSEIDGKIIFKLDDSKSVALSYETVERIANMLNNSEDKEQILEHMRQNRDNFLSILKLL